MKFFINLFASLVVLQAGVFAQQKPNIVIIYADDLGYGDISAYGATKIHTPNIDKLAKAGLSFSNAHASSATCTPSRYSLMTGTYAWRKKGTGIAPGNAALLIDTAKITLPSVLHKAGYATAAVGKWHIGLGPKGGPDWNGDIKPGPLEIGFDYAFLMPATTDRVPCVYIENHRVVNLDPNDPIEVSYAQPIGNEPTGKDHPELLKMKASHGHDQTIVNGIGRIGYMKGGKSALWVDDEVANVLTSKAINFITQHKNHPFFLYFATHDIHVPRVPNARFVGKSGMGPRGDAILQLDWTVGRVVKTLDSLGISKNTLLIFSSDNGPVVDDGYQDSAVLKLNGHTPAGPLRGGKYSAFDAGTRIPLITKWPGAIAAGTHTDALFSQLDLLASFAKLTGQKLSPDDAPDSFDQWDVLTGKSKKGRSFVVEHANTLSVIRDNWKYIEPRAGPAIDKNVNIELGVSLQPQLYNLNNDIGEKKNLAVNNPGKVKELAALLEEVKSNEIKRK
jgi:arylsulfatase A-like enzyme